MNSSWNTESKKKVNPTEPERAILVGIILPDQNEALIKEHLDELEFLASTAGAITIKRFVQKLNGPDSRTYIGKGKVEEILKYMELFPADMVIFDDDLSGKQQNILEEILKVKIIDRSFLILDIFASRAQTAQAKTQVELAQLQYIYPKLRGMWTHLERQRGGIGMRGPGEQEIETDRRIVKEKIALLKKKLEKIDLQNVTQRKNRDEMIRVSLIGYTNVGKSTLMNLISKSEVFAENKLFATLDTTVRKVVWDSMPFLLSDTVGFIRKLPHHLIESFKSTLDEVRESDIMVHVIDISHPAYLDQIKTVNETLKSLGLEDKPVVMVFNKMDAYREVNYDSMLDRQTKNELEEELKQSLKSKYQVPMEFISAKSMENIELLRKLLKELISKQYLIRYPYRSKQW
ncbi:MAG: GTPase HflX [Saprospiraceae bacterium]|nr:GTPase HflX [Candidatus Vicinibacter affinis]MBP6173678.1 GTPase HflX [Saprospiraceae bacterium]MBK6571395.1 GTPase HflX [Candidatus Vicinibacter affinis]MBK7800508.1 GTPase HflX [Candidatus Vicinibacter affinis]MBK8644224.1 GTPase HflX [Candidatus Vicinibacter affinis]